MTRCTHWRDASPEAVYVGRGPDPRTGRRMSGIRWANPGGPPRLWFSRLRRAPWVAERAQRELAGKQLCCDRDAVCYGDVLAALSRGERLADVEAEWRDAGLLGVQAGLFGEVV